MTFHAYSRARRLGVALGRIKTGEAVAEVAFDAGYDSLSGFGEAFRGFFGAPPKTAKRRAIVAIERLATPLGPMVAGATESGVCLLEFVDRRMLETQLERLQKRIGAQMVPGTSPLLAQLSEELEGYFAGQRLDFDVPLDTPGTDFQREVWAKLQTIGYGETRSYGELAIEMKRPKASRAVARANGDNRIAILIPCHRVIGADGSLTGYGGGLWRKQKLLDHERGQDVNGSVANVRD